MDESKSLSDEELIGGLDERHRAISAGYRDLFRLIVEAERRELWRDGGARDMAHWVCMRYGISFWKARRWIDAAHAIQELPMLSDALSSGELGVDKVVELARFATAETEDKLIRWAIGVSCGCIRRKGDLAHSPSAQEDVEAERARFLNWWYVDDGRRLGLEAELPAAQGAVVARALDRLGEQLSPMPGEEGPWDAPARRADALVALCSARIAGDGDPDRATVVVHASLEALTSGRGGSEVEGGGVISAETTKRLLCTARTQGVVEDQTGRVVDLGLLSRVPSAWMLRQLRYRDSECTFPGCGWRRFTQAHHIRHWVHGGPTDLENLALICAHHHRLVHEHGWRIRRGQNGTVQWFRPDGIRHRAGPAPPPGGMEPEAVPRPRASERASSAASSCRSQGAPPLGPVGPALEERQ